MPPEKDICRYDDSEFRQRVEDELWRSKDSFSVRLDRLEERVRQRDKWQPIMFGAAATGIFTALKILTDLIFK